MPSLSLAHHRILVVGSLCLALFGCEADALDPVADRGRADLDPPHDATPRDAARHDAARDAALDAADPDAAEPDAEPTEPDHALPVDAAADLGEPDLGELDLALEPDATPDADIALDAAADFALDAAPEPDAEPDAALGPGPHDDLFDRPALAPYWQVYNPDSVDLTVRDGALHLAPRPFALWFDRSRGPLVYQLVDGDFRVTARVYARRRSAPQDPPEQTVHLGGLMARDPATPPEDYVFIVVGRDVDDLSVETKTTRGGVSAYTGPAWPTSDAELRVCRLGALFRLYKRPILGGPWQLAETFDRPDLPARLQVGAIAYTNSAMPDLTVAFEEISFAPAVTEDDCAEE